MKRVGLLLVLFSLAFAQAAVSTENIKSEAYPNDVLEYKITFVNIGPTDVKINFAPFQTSFPSSVSLSKDELTLAPGESESVLLRIYVGDAKPGSYLVGVPYYENNEEKRVWLSVTILNPLPAFMDSNISVEGPTKVKIGENVTYEIVIQNPVRFVYADLNIKGIFNVSQRVAVKLGETRIPFSFVVPSLPPGKYWFNVTLLFPEGTVKTESTQLEVLPTVHCYTTYKEEHRGFLHVWKAEVKNIGNAEGTCDVVYPAAPLESLFKTEVSPGAQSDPRGVVWNVELAPGESKTLVYKSNTAPAAAIPIVLSVVIFGVWYFSNPLSVKKNVEAVTKAGTLTLNMRIYIKNRSFKPVKNVIVADPMPKFIKEVRDFGTVPGEVKYRAGKRYIIWRFDEIRPGEEIILNYKVRTSVEILGGIKLPGVKVEYEFGGKARKTETRKLIISF